MYYLLENSYVNTEAIMEGVYNIYLFIYLLSFI